MDSLSFPLLLQVIRDPELVKGFSNSAWTKLLHQARRHQLVGRLYVIFKHANLLHAVPEKPLFHLEALYKVSQAQCRTGRCLPPYGAEDRGYRCSAQ